MRKFISTRGNKEELTSAKGIIKGLAEDKGLLVPTLIPTLSDAGIDLHDFDRREGDASHKEVDYKEIAKKIIGAFFDDFTEEEIDSCIKGAYEGNFQCEEIVPIVNAGGAWFLELYHGRTSAFKDMALSILPYLLTTSLKKEGEKSKICILTATSGDTGKAALSGFSDVEGTEIVVFYPDGGVSEVQRAQMVTQEGANTHVFAIKGNFDDAQTGVKKIFNDEAFNERIAEIGVKLSSANSINIGRLIPQVAYYVYGYLKLCCEGVIKPGEEINVVVPTGNFGNILASYYAGLMGIPIHKYICASNENKVLTDFINTGIYDARRDFFLTNSPSMDILISSNLERLLYHLEKGADPASEGSKAASEILRLMTDLEEKGIYEVSEVIKEGLKKFYGGFATVTETNETIGSLYKNEGYLMDTHTSVAYKVYRDYVEETGDARPTLIASTASPYKFARSVAESIGISGLADDFEYVEALSKETGIPIPEGLKDLNKKPILHKDVIEISEMGEVVVNSTK